MYERDVNLFHVRHEAIHAWVIYMHEYFSLDE